MAAKDILSTENIYKLIIGALAWCGLYFGLKSDVRDNKTANDKDHFFYEWRLTKLEEKVGIPTIPLPGSGNAKQVVFNQLAAVPTREITSGDIIEEQYEY